MKKLSVLIPYRILDNVVQVYLQRRSQTRKRSPGKIGFFGGHLEEHETPVEALLREIKEELKYDLVSYELLETQQITYGENEYIKHVYYAKVPDDFERQIIVLKKEGEGEWFTKEMILADPLLIPQDKPCLEHFFEKIEIKT